MRKITKFLGIACLVGLLGIVPATEAKADELTLSLNDKWVSGNFSENESDFYSINVTEPGRLTIVYQSTSDNLAAHLYDGDMITEYRYFSIDGSQESPQTKSMEIDVEKGTYIFKTTGYWGDSGNYRLKARLDAAKNNEKEPNQTYDNAMSIKESQAVTGFFSQTDSVDYYKISLKSGRTVRCIVNSEADEYCFTIYDSNLYEKYNCNGNNTGLRTYETKLGAGTYYVKMQCSNANYIGNTGKYTLKWKGIQYVTGVTLKSKLVAIEKGKKMSLIKTIKPADATNKKLSWTTDNRSVVAVDTSGKITAKAPGVATITATTKDGTNITVESTIVVKPNKAEVRKCNIVNGRYAKIVMKKQKGISGIQYQMCRKSNFKGKTSTYFGNSEEFVATSDILTANKDYYIRVRYYTELWGHKYYGDWSKVCKLKTKKSGYLSGYYAWKDCK